MIFLFKKYLSFFSVLFLLFTVNAYSAQIYGQVMESVTSSTEARPSNSNKISSALIVIEGTNFQAATNSSGFFAFPENIPDGVYNIGAYKDGYNLETKKVNVQGHLPISLTFILTKKQQAPTLSMGTVPSAINIPDAVYVAFASIASSSQSSSGASPTTPGSSMTTSLQFRAAIAAGADPTNLTGMPAPGIDLNPANISNRGESYTPVTTNPNSIAVMDPHNPKQTTYVNFNTKPHWLTFDNSGTKIFISTDTQYIVVLDVAAGNRVIGSIPTGGIVTDITRAPDGNVYASVSGARKGIVVISPSTNAATAFYEVKPSAKMSKDAQPRALAIGPDFIYVAMASNSTGEVLALNRSGGAMRGACEVGAFPSGICLTPNGKYLFVANRNSGDVSVVDTSRMSVLGRVRVGSQPTRVVSSPLGDRIYVTNFASNYLSVIDGRTGGIVATINTGKGPIGLGITPDGTRVFVANNTENNVTIINAESNTVIQTTTPSTSSKPFGIAVKP